MVPPQSSKVRGWDGYHRRCVHKPLKALVARREFPRHQRLAVGTYAFSMETDSQGLPQEAGSVIRKRQPLRDIKIRQLAMSPTA